MAEWYARPVFFVADLTRSIAFCTRRLGFTESWRYDEDGELLVAQVERPGFEVIFSSQRQEKVGAGVSFMLLDLDVLEALRAEYDGKGVEVRDGRWGYPLMIVDDSDGNMLWSAYPADYETRSS